MRKIMISDIHGCYDEFVALLEKVNFIPHEDQLILLGDYVDRGLKSKEVVQLVMKLVREDGAIAIGGNHEDLFLSWLEDEENEEEEMYFPQGGSATVFSFCEPYGLSRYGDPARNIIQEYYSDEISFLSSLPDYYEDEEFIYVHAGFNPVLADWRNSTRNDFRWIRQHFWNAKHETGKNVFFGHTPTIHFWENTRFSNDPYEFEGKNLIAIDGGCVFGGQLNAFVTEGNKMGFYHVKKMGV